MIKLDNLSFSYGKNKWGLNSVSFNVPKGAYAAFLGPNGSGKTTTIKCIFKLLKVNSNAILIDQKPISGVEYKKDIAFVPSKTTSKSPIKVWDFIINNLMLHGLSKKEAKDNAYVTADYFGAKELLHKKISKMSDGQLKLISIIYAFSANAKIYILDEPTTYLDIVYREKLYKLLKLEQEKGKTILVSTHELEEFEEYVDYIIIINNGRVLYDDKKTKFNKKFGKNMSKAWEKAVLND